MKKYSCKLCGQTFTSVRALTASNCARHPAGRSGGKHQLYEGSEKSTYTCKYCGHISPSLISLTGTHCPLHPDGSNKGNHSPAL